MKLKLDEVTDILQKEIDWCLKNTDPELTQEYQEGFVGGLKQAQDLIKIAEQILVDENFYFGLPLERPHPKG